MVLQRSSAACERKQGLHRTPMRMEWLPRLKNAQPDRCPPAWRQARCGELRQAFDGLPCRARTLLLLPPLASSSGLPTLQHAFSCAGCPHASEQQCPVAPTCIICSRRMQRWTANRESSQGSKL